MIKKDRVFAFVDLAAIFCVAHPFIEAALKYSESTWWANTLVYAALGWVIGRKGWA